jgi:hypothetical protein
MQNLTVKSSLALLVAAVGVAACEGDNMFTGPGSADPDVPQVLAVVVPEEVRPGDVLDVEISAASEDGIILVEVTLIEDIVRERTLAINPPETDLAAFTEFQLPSTLAQETVVVQVEVQDLSGARSEPFEVEIPVLPAESSF